LPVAASSEILKSERHGIRVAGGRKLEMNVRSITIVVAALVMSTVAGFAQAWTKGSQGSTTWTVPSTQTQTPPQAQPQKPAPAQPLQPAQPLTRQVPTGSTESSPEQSLYTDVNVGGAYQQNATVETTVTPSGGPPTMTSQNTTFNLGVRGDVALGYNISDSWAAEFNTGLIWNSAGNSQPYPYNASIDTYTVPILVNAVYRIPFKGPWSSYLGVGGGGAVSILSYNASSYNLGSYNFAFAYQAKAGLEYRLTDKASIDLAYEFLGTTDPSWSFSQTVGGTTTDYSVKEKGFFTHSVVISFTWTF
jgi:opacity protein-like surface antigen